MGICTGEIVYYTSPSTANSSPYSSAFMERIIRKKPPIKVQHED